MINCIIVDDEQHAIDITGPLCEANTATGSGGQFYQSYRSTTVIGGTKDRPCFP